MSPAHESPASARKLIGVACLSSAILLVELGITRLFSVITWYHFAFLAVSLALFGLSASGVYLHVTQYRHAPERPGWIDRQLNSYALVFSALTIILAVLLLRTRIGTLFTSKNLFELVGVYLLTAAPFFAGGAALALAISRLHADINRVYAADLGGAAAGCMLFLAALETFGGPGPLFSAAALAAIAAYLFAEPGRRRTVAAAAAVAIVAALGVHSVTPLLDLKYTKAGERPFLFIGWNSHSRIAVYPEKHADWGLSERYTGTHPETLFMDIDASASTPIIRASTLADVEFLRSEVTSLGYRLLPQGGHTLVIGPGGGRDLWTSLLFGAARVTGVEINSIIVNDVMSGRFRKESGDVYHRPGVEVFVADGRSFVARSTDHYDLIQASLVDTWAATAAGAFALTENNLYTVEAFVDYINHLKPDGVLTMSRWTNDGLRLVALAKEAGVRLGWRSLDEHLFIAGQRKRADGYGNLSSFVIKRSPLTPDDVKRLREAAASLDFEVYYAPPSAGAPAMGEPEIRELVATSDPGAFYDRVNWDCSPVTDDRPFFFQTVKRMDLARYLRTALFSGETDGMSLLVRLLYISAILVVAFILIPLGFQRRRRPGQAPELPLPLLAWFACLGVGFMLIEIGLMQRFVLFLGHPVYALTVVLFTLLLGGGLGSSLSRRIGAPARTLRLVLPAIVLAAVVYAFLLPSVFELALGIGRTARIATSVALLLPLGVLLGMPLPAGIRLVGSTRPHLVPWAWAINGATSVLGSIVAIFLALLLGFRAVALIGAGVYLMAFVLASTVRAMRGEAEAGAPASGESATTTTAENPAAAA